MFLVTLSLIAHKHVIFRLCFHISSFSLSVLSTRHCICHPTYFPLFLKIQYLTMLLPQRETDIHSTSLFQAKGIKFERRTFCSKLVPHCRGALQEVLLTSLILFHKHFGNLSKQIFYLMNMSCINRRVKDRLDITCYFISLLMCSKCLGH